MSMFRIQFFFRCLFRLDFLDRQISVFIRNHILPLEKDLSNDILTNLPYNY
jgi:hypothetical protein